MSAEPKSTDADQVAVFLTPLGWIAVCWQEERLQRVVIGHASRSDALAALGCQAPVRARLTAATRHLVERLQAAAAGQEADFSDVPLAIDRQTPFQIAVMKACREIPWGRVVTYGELADRAGYPGRARAVGNVMAANPVPLVVPCHRVVAANGRLGGFSAPDGIAMKCRLLRSEGVPLSSLKLRVPLGAEIC